MQLLAKDPELGPALDAGRLRPYPPMPPLIDTEDGSGRPERTLAVGLLADGRGVQHEIVGVNLVRRTVVRLDGGAPATALAVAATCGVRHVPQRTTGGLHVPGEAIVTVKQGATTLWRFRVVRPAATKGPHRSTNGTGVELRYVDYRGKRVLYRAHAPILNVKYAGDKCGPYRDWQNEEGMIHATGRDVAPGFRLCPAPATTILETGSDRGQLPRRRHLRGGRLGRAGQRARGGLVPLHQQVAPPRRRDDQAPVRLQRRRELMRLQRPPPSRLLAARLRHTHAREEPCAGVQRPASARARSEEMARPPFRGRRARATRGTSDGGASRTP